MLYTNNLPGTPLIDLTSKQIGKHEDNIFQTTRANSLSDKGSARPLSTPLPHQGHGTINQFQWILIEPERQEEIGEAKEEAHREEM